MRRLVAASSKQWLFTFSVLNVSFNVGTIECCAHTHTYSTCIKKLYSLY